MSHYIVYGGESGVHDIDEHAQSLASILYQYSVPVKAVKLDKWETTGSEELTGSENEKVVYITSIENEDFHTKVKQVFTQGKSNCMVVLQHEPKDENHVDRFRTSIKKSLKKTEPNKVARKRLIQDALSRIATVTDIKKFSIWLPRVLKFLIQAPADANTNQHIREIGIYFKIDWDDEYQVEWLQMQKDALENDFRIRCRHNGNFMDEDIYIARSTCVVMYADRTRYQNLLSREAQTEGEQKLLNSINETRVTCSNHATKFQVFFDQAGVELTNKLANDYHLQLVGTGMIYHWIGLLSMLDLVRVKRVRDSMFYSEMLSSHENELERFNEDKYPQVFGRKSVTARSVASLSDVNLPHRAGSVDQASYQSIDVAIDNKDVVTIPSFMCCSRLQLLNI